MSASRSHDLDARTIKGKKSSASNAPSIVNPGHSGPTTFFLRSEKDIERSAHRGRKASSSPSSPSEDTIESASRDTMARSSFGVESLADTISSAFGSDDLSRTTSNSTDAGAGAEASMTEDGAFSGRKRKAGNPVHPKIHATGQRILSSEQQPSTQASSAGSPLSFRSSESPFGRRLRRGSATSSLDLNSQPITPLKLSPQPQSELPGTPRSSSPKSLALSDESGSIADETGSQAVQSSSGEEDAESIAGQSRTSVMPQLVMPSIAMPARRPFTERGRRIGRLKVLVAGYDGVGKTSLIQSILRTCDDIVHVDQPVANSIDDRLQISETLASTRPHPAWWSDVDGRRISHRRKSIGDGVLKRNLCFVDTPGMTEEAQAQQVLRYLNQTLLRTVSLETMTDSELINLLSGEGGSHIDAVLWIFDPATVQSAEASELLPAGPQRFVFEALCESSNLVPLIGHADTLSAEEATTARVKVLEFMRSIDAEPYSLSSFHCELSDSEDTAGSATPEPLCVSSALMDDTEEVDASVLMNSQYMRPLVPSELSYLVEQLTEPDNVARMRHMSATKFLLWRQQYLGFQNDLPKHTLLRSPQFGNTLPSVPSSNSMLDGPSKVLVPHSNSSFYRSSSPSASDSSALSANADSLSTSSHALAHHDNQTQMQEATQPFRQVRLAKWAQDLQRSLLNERKRYLDIYSYKPPGPHDWAPSSSDDSEKALTNISAAPQRPAKGRLGGDIAIIDPRDPLGILAFSQICGRHMGLALRVAGVVGAVGAVAWWVVRNWEEVQGFLGWGQEVVVVGTAVPPPERGWGGWRAVVGV
ncbi:hypothetical protein B0A50_01514 [Salinomyces thailandicus]|uniref:Septin-type G domain-containing protein n=1 Tax=Salinomyces thailandicus TaxID=706561 RepID=A0A4U0UAS9_9PEZI|nr:hypothetical protein B0A50_01514 [Salinomyces thailandica]